MVSFKFCLAIIGLSLMFFVAFSGFATEQDESSKNVIVEIRSSDIEAGEKRFPSPGGCRGSGGVCVAIDVVDYPDDELLNLSDCVCAPSGSLIRVIDNNYEPDLVIAECEFKTGFQPDTNIDVDPDGFVNSIYTFPSMYASYTFYTDYYSYCTGGAERSESDRVQFNMNCWFTAEDYLFESFSDSVFGENWAGTRSSTRNNIGPLNSIGGVNGGSLLVNGEFNPWTIYPPGQYVAMTDLYIKMDMPRWIQDSGEIFGATESVNVNASGIQIGFSKATAPPCMGGGFCEDDADLDGDGFATIDDLVLWLGNPVDLTRDGIINNIDALVFADALGIDPIDCDENGEMDELELYIKECADINSNGILDSCEFPDWDIGEAPCVSDVPLANPQPGGGIAMDAYPNPFNPRTTIRFEMPETSVGRLVIYDSAGREISVLVDSRPLAAGAHEYSWDGRSKNGSMAPAGVYFYQLVSRAGVGRGKLALLK